jgi:hypothetical protein
MLLQPPVLARTLVGIDGATESPPAIVVVVACVVVVVAVCPAGQLAGAVHLFAMKVPAWSLAGAPHVTQYRSLPTVSVTVRLPCFTSSSVRTVDRVTSFSRAPAFIRSTRTGAGWPPMKRPTYDVADWSEVQPSPEGIESAARSPVAEFRTSTVAPVEAGDPVGSVRAEGAVTSRIRWRAPESLRTRADASSGWSAAVAARDATRRRLTATARINVVGGAHT